MPKKIMVTLYYASAEDARTDCDILSIDRRNVTSLNRGRYSMGYSKTTGHYGHKMIEGKLEKVEISHILRVAETKVAPKVDKLHHVDDEADW